MAENKEKPPWEKPTPKRGPHKKLTATEEREAKASAKKAGRPYPNLVDNMKMARRKK